MKLYYGTKLIKAQPMTLGAYKDYREWDIPEDEDPETAGYLVEYTNGEGGNHVAHEGYISWSPAQVFESSYQPTEALDFGHALHAMKDGARILRDGWNGKNMWLALIDAENYTIHQAPYGDGQDSEEGDVKGLLPWIGMRTADGKFVPWLASQSDLLAEDWRIHPDTTLI